jgi:hypothetical protein
MARGIAAAVTEEYVECRPVGAQANEGVGAMRMMLYAWTHFSRP